LLDFHFHSPVNNGYLLLCSVNESIVFTTDYSVQQGEMADASLLVKAPSVRQFGDEIFFTHLHAATEVDARQ
jgi:hypothetical protein